MKKKPEYQRLGSFRSAVHLFRGEDAASIFDTAAHVLSRPRRELFTSTGNLLPYVETINFSSPLD